MQFNLKIEMLSISFKNVEYVHVQDGKNHVTGVVALLLCCEVYPRDGVLDRITDDFCSSVISGNGVDRLAAVENGIFTRGTNGLDRAHCHVLMASRRKNGSSC